MSTSRIVCLPLLLLLLCLLTACGGGTDADEPANNEISDSGTAASTTTKSSTADIGPTDRAPSTAQPVSLIDTELLGAVGVNTTCDGSDGVAFVCASTATNPHFEVTTDGGSFARWQLHIAQVAQPLTGDETLLIRLRHRGNLTPNLYLVERDGRRVAVALARYGFSKDKGEDEQTIAIPLREIRDEADQWPNFTAVNALQLVFEWAAMTGELELASLQFVSVWREAVLLADDSRDLAANLTLPTGFVATAIADQLREVTQLYFSPEKTGSTILWASTQPGRIWRYMDRDGDGIYEERLLYATGFEEVVGLLLDPVDGAVWVGGRGKLIRTADSDGDGVADQRETRLEGLPWGRHQNNGLAWNPDPDPFTGESGHQWIYFGLGSTEDLEVGGEWNAQVLRFPRDGQGQNDLQTVSRGNRNPYMVIWAPVPVDPTALDGETAWQLFASENGPDFNDAPDEVNHIRWQHNYGFPKQFGMTDLNSSTGAASVADRADGEQYSGPIYPVLAHASASGLAYVTNPTWPVAYRTLYVSLFGQVFGEGVAGHRVERITLEHIPRNETSIGTTYRGIPSVFVAGLDRPLPMTTTPAGNLVIGDYATGGIYRIDYIGEGKLGEKK